MLIGQLAAASCRSFIPLVGQPSLEGAGSISTMAGELAVLAGQLAKPFANA